jgi:hypothetical protein
MLDSAARVKSQAELADARALGGGWLTWAAAAQPARMHTAKAAAAAVRAIETAARRGWASADRCSVLTLASSPLANAG